MSLRILGVLGVGLASIMVAPSAAAATQDSLTGFGRATVGDEFAAIAISARSDTSGESPSGVFRFHREGTHNLSGVADVLCLEVDGLRAAVVGRIRTSVPVPGSPGEFYQYVVVTVFDNGSPGTEIDEFNVGLVWGPPGRPAPSCSFFSGGTPSEAGNFTVVDAALT